MIWEETSASFRKPTYCLEESRLAMLLNMASFPKPSQRLDSTAEAHGLTGIRSQKEMQGQVTGIVQKAWGRRGNKADPK